jgi:hypothetical protein
MALLTHAARLPCKLKPAGPLRALALAAAILSAYPAGLRAQTANEYDVKAAFLYKFASFVEWPPQNSAGPVCIGVIGQDPFGEALDEVVKGKTINGRPFAIRRFMTVQDAQDCQIVFVSASETKRLRGILERLQNRAVLTVGDTPGFCQSGGMINFELEDSYVRLEINLKSAERARLQVSSKLLRLAKLVPDVSTTAFK